MSSHGMIALLALSGVSPGPPADTVEIAPRPRVEIGASAADPDDQLSEVVAVRRGPRGEILVAEGRSGRIRIYDGDGRFVGDVGGSGDGPGEFREILDMAVAGGSVVVLDRDGRVTRLSLDGEVRGTWRIDLGGLVDETFNPVPAGVLPDAAVVVRAAERAFGRPDGEYVPRAGFLTVHPGGAVDTLAFVPSHRVRSEGGLPRPYRPWVEATWAAGGGAVWIASPVRRRIERAGDGGVVIEAAWADRPPLDEDLARFRAAYVDRGRTPNDRRVIAEWVDGSPVADAVPPFRNVEVDGQGRVWVERWTPPGEGTLWRVFGPGGRALCEAHLAQRLHLEDAGDGWIVGVWEDPLGVERVRVYGWSGCGVVAGPGASKATEAPGPDRRTAPASEAPSSADPRWPQLTGRPGGWMRTAQSPEL